MSPLNKSAIKRNNSTIKSNEIRILPMSLTEEFENQDIHEIQQNYFIDELKGRKNGHYDYRVKGINAEVGDLVLFQISNRIIASATYLELGAPSSDLDSRYTGSIIFDKDSIRIFEPITASEIRAIDGSFKKFSQAKQILNAIYYDAIVDLINQKVELLEEDPEDEDGLNKSIPEILHIHKQCFEFLDNYRLDGEKLLFLPRKKDTKFQRREDGYYFIGNKDYLQITFWNGDDTKEKIHNISFLILSDGSSYIEISSRDDEHKAERLRALVDYLSEHTRLKFNEIKPNRWNAKFEEDDYLESLNSFIENEKKIIDGFIRSESNCRIELLYEGNCKKYIDAINILLEKHSNSNQKGVIQKPVGSFRISKSEYQMDLLHNKIQNSLCNVLERSGNYESLEMEKNHVDITGFRKDGKVEFYELKIGKVKSAIREALGQILEYNHYPKHDRASQMFIVSNERPTDDDIEYLNYLRVAYGLNLYYRYFNVVDNVLSDSY